MDPMGIENPLNLCFMISAIQALMSVEQFNGYISRKSKFYNTDCFQITATTPKRNFTTTVTWSYWNNTSIWFHLRISATHQERTKDLESASNSSPVCLRISSSPPNSMMFRNSCSTSCLSFRIKWGMTFLKYPSPNRLQKLTMRTTLGSISLLPIVRLLGSKRILLLATLVSRNLQCLFHSWISSYRFWVTTLSSKVCETTTSARDWTISTNARTVMPRRKLPDHPSSQKLLISWFWLCASSPQSPSKRLRTGLDTILILALRSFVRDMQEIPNTICNR